ncbi:hypothetical protein [Corynebacterium sp.]|uniref:hypothetical protein n=1 Tax=Corynebacterium sp. TaxID=1720 RepID=UPI0026DD4A45|nr:hypothetical protein [Corynebacterium sp.]MDO5077885.1 hypothetical protein [Corynebacterium sp.]
MRLQKLLTAAVIGLSVTIYSPAAIAADQAPAATTTHGAESSNSDAWYYRATDDQRNLEIKVSDEYRFKAHDDGGVSVVDDGDVLEELPTEGVNKQGQKITFHYELQPDNILLVSIADEHGNVNEGWWDDWGRCAAGTVGGTGTGAIAGAGTAAGIGAVGGPWGVGAGAIGGGIAGGISGGLTGAAASC